MKSIVARPILLASGLYLLTGLTATQAYSSEYFIYQDAKGGLVISNQKPPPGSKIIKQQTLPDTAEGETTLVQDGNEMRPNATPSKPSNKE
jgi:hypothetical protein